MPSKKKRQVVQDSSQNETDWEENTSAQIGEGYVNKISNAGLIKTDFDDTVTFTVEAVRPPTNNLQNAFSIGQRVKFSATRRGTKWTADIVCPFEMAGQFFYNVGVESASFFNLAAKRMDSTAVHAPQPLGFMSSIDTNRFDQEVNICRLYSQLSRDIADLVHSIDGNPKDDCPLCQEF